MPTKTVILIQGIYYLLTALWPLFHIRSFEKVTGPKTDHWLVYTVSVMIFCSSLVFLSAGLGPFMIGKEILILAFSNALVLAAVDIIFSLKNIIRKVYLLDAAAEISLVIVLLLSL
jgi:hypothetical protein